MIAGLAAIFVRSVIVLAWLYAGLRIAGKKRVGQMNILDLALLMAMANSIQNAMTMGKGDLLVGIVSALALFLTGWIFMALILRFPRTEERLVGAPTVLVHDGVLVKNAMEREGVSREELMAAIREHETGELSKVKVAVLEVDGSISIIEARRDP